LPLGALIGLAVQVLAALGMLATIVGGLLYLSDLATRIPHTKLQQNCRKLARNLALWGGFFAVLVAFAISPASTALVDTTGRIVVLMSAGWIGIGVLWHMSSLSDLMRSYRKTLESAAAPR
jgi:hypothetical protein